MRKHIKGRLSEISESVLLMHNEIVNMNNIEEMISSLVMCQECAVAIGEILEKEGIYRDKITILENYCEEIFILSQKELIINGDFETASNMMRGILDFIVGITVKTEVVFFPYQASMWDSLESVWQAFEKRTDCICSVIPIPYSEYQAKEGTWKPCYHGYDYPDYVDVIDYKKYDIKEMKPDIAFVHNPYDEFNYITRVDENYYSHNLKKYVKTLVYIPYFVTDFEFDGAFLDSSVYYHADYLIMQSEGIKKQFKGSKFYNKILALGSPKFDRVINVCKNGGKMPLKWRDKLEGKTIVMLNATIHTLLEKRADLFDKLNEVFDKVKNNDYTTVIWRPHPLFEATVKSMCPELINMYNDTMNRFINEDIGILDKTPDITNTVALCDGYIGDRASSVVDLFAVVGKPIFVLDYDSKNRVVPINQQRRFSRKIKLVDIVFVNDEYWAISNTYNVLFKINSGFNEIESVIYFPDADMNQVNNYFRMISDVNKLYLAPFNAKRYCLYDVEKNKFEIMHDNIEKDKNNLAKKYWQIIKYLDKIIYLPHLGNDKIAIYDIENKSCNYHKQCICEISKYMGENKLPLIQNYCTDNNKLYMCARYINIVIEFNLDTEEYVFHEVGEKEFAYTAVQKNGDALYLTELKGDIICYDIMNTEYTSISITDKLTVWKNPDSEMNRWKYWACSSMILFDDYVIAIPAFSNSLVKINTNTKKVTLLLPELFEDFFVDENNIFAACNIAKKIDEKTLLIQINKSGRWVKIDIEDETYTYADLEWEENEHRKYVNHVDILAFRKAKNTYILFKKENIANSLEYFLADLNEGILDEIKHLQEESISNLAKNLDGTCGEKICESIMSK